MKHRVSNFGLSFVSEREYVIVALCVGSPSSRNRESQRSERQPPPSRAHALAFNHRAGVDDVRLNDRRRREFDGSAAGHKLGDFDAFAVDAQANWPWVFESIEPVEISDLNASGFQLADGAIGRDRDAAPDAFLSRRAIRATALLTIDRSHDS